MVSHRQQERDGMTAGTSSAGLSEIVRRGDLRLCSGAENRRFSPTPFDDELLAVVDAASAKGTPVALVIPLPPADTPVVLGAASLLAEIARTSSLAVTSTVVSPRLSQRGFYDQLCVGTSRLADVIPRARLTTGGAVVPTEVTPPAAGGARMVLTSDVARVPDFGGALVVDGAGGKPEELNRLLRTRARLVYLTNNPFDEALAEVRAANGVVWTFDPATLAQFASNSPDTPGRAVAAPLGLLAAAGTAQRQVYVPSDDTSLDIAMGAAWTALRALTTTGSDAIALTSAVRWAWSTFQTFSLSATEPLRYDRYMPRSPYSTLLTEAPEHARAVARNSTGATREQWMTLAEAFRTLLDAAVPAPKIDLIQRWLTDANERGLRGVLVTRNGAAARAITSALQERSDTPFNWRAKVDVVGLRDLLYGRVPRLPSDTTLFTGPVPRTSASLVAVPSAEEVVVVTAGKWEASRSARQMTQTLTALTALRRETVEISAPKLGVPAAETVEHPHPVLVWRDDISLDPMPDDSSPWEPFTFDVLAMLSRHRGGSADDSTAVPPSRGDRSVIDALRISLTDGRYLWLSPNDTVYRRTGDEVRRVAAKALARGDVIVLVDATARRDLFKSVINTLATVDPQYHLLTFFEKLWHDGVEAARNRDMTGRMVLSRMQNRQDPTPITTEQTVGNWLNHRVVPMHAADVRRFADATENDELARNADAVGSALLRLRTIHQAVGRWLSAQITGAKLGVSNTLVDPRLGIHVADLLDVVSLHEVEDVPEHLDPVHVTAVGIVHDAELVDSG